MCVRVRVRASERAMLLVLASLAKENFNLRVQLC